jgi:pimeloyl-ACP methyl ester carboxylesterase
MGETMAESTWLTVTTQDGRKLEVLVEGPEDGIPLVYHSGTPSAAVSYPALSDAAAGQGLRTIAYSRPGYGESTPQPGRSVADVAADVSAILAAVGVDSFVTLGWSGGGPHALACAALMPEACKAAATLAGVAPSDASGLDWLDGMGEDNVEEFGAANAGADALTAFLTPHVAELSQVTSAQVVAGLGDLVSDVDKVAAQEAPLADYLAASFRRAFLHGLAGWRDDDLAFARPWGFTLDAITTPVTVWQGGQDRMVPFAHGRWLAAHVPGATARLYDDEGHLSLARQLGRIFTDLAQTPGVADRRVS